MRITRYTDYSLRVLIYVGAKGERLSTIREIADAYGISKNHLMKVVHQLNLKGYLETVRGKHGGIRLSRAPETVNVGTLIRDLEPDTALVECFHKNNACVITPACELKNILSEALDAFFATLDRYTLADMLPAKRMRGLIKLLGIDAAA